MKKAYHKDIWRAIQNGKKRFFSLMLITVLGVTMMSGLKAACVDLRRSADSFFDRQGLFDIVIMSTLGMTSQDVRVLSELEEVETAEGAYNTTVYTVNHGKRQSAEVKTLSKKGINEPYVLEGTLPESSEEIAVTEKFVKETGKAVGDTLTIEEKDETLTFSNKTFRITAVVTDAADVNNPNGSVSFRVSESADYTFFVVSEAVDSDISTPYTAVYLVLSGSRELFSYSTAYEEKVSQAVQNIESQIKEQQEQKRNQSVLDEAYVKLEEAQKEMDAQIADAQKKLQEAEEELEQGKNKLEAGEQELALQEAEANAKFAKAWREIGQGYQEIEEGQEQLQQSAQELEQGESQLIQGKDALKQKQEETIAQIQTAHMQLEESRTKLTASKEQAVLAAQQPGILPEELEKLQVQISQLEAGLAELEMQSVALQQKQTEAETQFAAAWQEISAQESQLINGKAQLEAGLAELEGSRVQLETGTAELIAKEEEAKQQIAEGKLKLEESRKKLEEGEQELLSGRQELEEERTKAEEELQKACREIAQMDMAHWYVQDRSSLSGYSNIESDASCIEAIGTAFPVLFLVVAILISLTTVTRMVEEDRGLIGTYKALGFTDGEILKKYLIYAAAACLLGGIIGDIGGFVVLPEIIFIIFRTMYLLPEYHLQFDILYGFGGIVLFMVGITGATVLACLAEVRLRPAVLMRPKAPRLGSRVILEHLPFLWNRFSFLNKVTARNLFRYKKRLFMTVAGIMGCTALLVCGFAIKDTVTDLMPGQYEQIYQYDFMAVSSAEDNEKLLDYMKEEQEVLDYLNVQIDTVKVKNAQGEEQKVQMIVVPQGSSLEGYIHLKNEAGKTVALCDSGIFMTQNAADVLHFEKGDMVQIQNLKLVQKETSIEELVQNYLGNAIYITQDIYEALFGAYEPNGVLANLSEQCINQRDFAEDFGKRDGILSSVSTQELRQDFSKAFTLINMVVYIVIILAAGLALVVLFTLSTTNISERERELATIKVLGFYDREVHLYVNKETLILTLIGILFGLPLGGLFGSYLTYVLKMPSIYFAVSIHPLSYLLAAVIAFGFALVVDCITDRTLDRIDPVEALKSVE